MNQPQFSPKPSDRWIPWYIFGFFVLLVSVLVPMCIVAVRTNTGVVTDGAYEKGLAYNQAIQAKEQQDALHWKGDLSLIPVDDMLHVGFHLQDSAKKPLENAEVKVWLVRPTQNGMDQHQAMQSHGDGDYHAELRVPQRGQWEARISATLEGHNYQMTQRVVVP